ncbi:D-cysteine desulfhydrase family protein [Amycolatopsis regifaucium]|uniref:1-aminocyclopropane-1-carboxylate deaminase n=1 Tax=Amycolatopsis regifaucium TaxID=546365 RepID=A0A154MDY7_9PSEU|nr:D-cysteine desulfhydrase family protein [Amycolatopsis regifaucium]KZB81839.1 1-aminocyclopropane-1-carboxylate deaminase [Amycolatopsis regifaucium]OKA06092.1 1-aminocyclopropane-1-carboxylate deaminase [Amycolatopsis regifaucium]SFG73912.1 D-cysteine desulfhydrase [Amycolatopsis regifaucium]
MNLDRFPRVDLGGYPTPLHPAPRLAEALGLENLLLKRDDVHPLGVGGNKLRKLEFLLGAAIEAGADTVITFGALQTNHGRQTAAACAKLGLRCELVLTAKVPRDGDAYERSGNVSLDHLFGANVHICRDGEETGKTYDRLLTEAAAEGREVATFPVGGSDAVGALGYVAAAREIAGQLADRGITKARLVAPHASGGTSAGLVVGTADLDWLTLDIACVSHPVDEALDNLADLTTAASALLGRTPPSLEGLHVDDRAIGPGYGIPTAETWDAVRLFGRTEGIALDPVYTGKVGAALIAWAAEGHFAADEHVVFLHTGGLPGLYGYAPEFADAVRG